MSSHASSYAPTPNASAEALDPRATLLKATQALGMHESTAEQRFATVMGPRAREKLVQEAMAAGFRLEGDSDEDFVRRVLDKLAAPAVEAVTDASGAALKEARTALLEAAGSATTINSRVAEAKTKFQGRLDELLALVTSIKAKQKHIDAIDATLKEDYQRDSEEVVLLSSKDKKAAVFDAPTRELRQSILRD